MHCNKGREGEKKEEKTVGKRGKSDTTRYLQFHKHAHVCGIIIMGKVINFISESIKIQVPKMF